MHRKHPLGGPSSRTGRLAVGTAAALLTLGLATPATASTDTADIIGAESTDDAKQKSGTNRLIVSPASGGHGTQVTIKARCRPAGSAVSTALQRPVALTQQNGTWSGTGKIKESGLQVGQTYRIKVLCENGSEPVGSFTLSATPTGGASAGFGGSQDGSSLMTPLAIGGGIAVAGAIGYIFTARRRSAGTYY